MTFRKLAASIGVPLWEAVSVSGSSLRVVRIDDGNRSNSTRFNTPTFVCFSANPAVGVSWNERPVSRRLLTLATWII